MVSVTVESIGMSVWLCWRGNNYSAHITESEKTAKLSSRVWQNLLDGKVALWVAAAYPIWQEVDHKAPDAMQQATHRVTAVFDFLLGKAQQEGFPASKLLSGMALRAQWPSKHRVCPFPPDVPVTK